VRGDAETYVSFEPSFCITKRRCFGEGKRRGVSVVRRFIKKAFCVGSRVV